MTVSLLNIDVSLYGIVYLLGSLLFFLLEQNKRRSTLNNIFLTSIFTIGAICGGRIFYVLVYEPSYYLNNLSEIPQIYKGGMSFHGGVIGVITALLFTNRKESLTKIDSVCKCALVIIPLGRLANFTNGELFGRITDLPLGVVFEGVDQHLRHPSQIYEAVAEGPLILLIMYVFSRKRNFIKNQTPGIFAAKYIIIYSILRFFVEFTREPDAFLGFIGPWEVLTLGQVLCLIFLLSGLIFFRKLKHN